VKPEARIMSRSITVTEDGESASGCERRDGDSTTGISSKKSVSLTARAPPDASAAASRSAVPARRDSICRVLLT